MPRHRAAERGWRWLGGGYKGRRWLVGRWRWSWAEPRPFAAAEVDVFAEEYLIDLAAASYDVPAVQRADARNVWVTA